MCVVPMKRACKDDSKIPCNPQNDLQGFRNKVITCMFGSWCVLFMNLEKSKKNEKHNLYE